MSDAIELFHIVLGPGDSTQTPFLRHVFSEMQRKGKFGKRNLEFVFITIQEVISLKLTASEFLAWCRKAKYLLWAGHPLQNDFGPLWNHSQFMNDLRDICREKGKRVFPPAEAMHAAFSQDKQEIYETLEEFMLPSFTIYRPTGPDEKVETFDEEVLSQLYDFCTNNYEIHEDVVGGWFVKVTGTTGGKGVDSTNKLSMVPAFVRSLMNRNYFQYKETVIVQPSMGNRKEIKYYILTNPHTGEETEPEIAYNAKNSSGRSFREHPHVVEFVKRVKRKYEEKYGKFSTCPVFRVDLFISQDGRLIVNEVEHFEAQIDAAKESKDFTWKKFIPEFWEDQILFMVN